MWRQVTPANTKMKAKFDFTLNSHLQLAGCQDKTSWICLFFVALEEPETVLLATTPHRRDP